MHSVEHALPAKVGCFGGGGSSGRTRVVGLKLWQMIEEQLLYHLPNFLKAREQKPDFPPPFDAAR